MRTVQPLHPAAISACETRRSSEPPTRLRDQKFTASPAVATPRTWFNDADISGVHGESPLRFVWNRCVSPGSLCVIAVIWSIMIGVTGGQDAAATRRCWPAPVVDSRPWRTSSSFFTERYRYESMSMICINMRPPRFVICSKADVGW